MEMKTDYPELENVVIEHINDDFEETDHIANSKAIGCNFDVGLTLIQTDEDGNPAIDHRGEEIYLVCIHGKSSPLYIKSVRSKNVRKEKYDEYYSALFYKTVEMIKDGLFDLGEFLELSKTVLQNPNMVVGNANSVNSSTCAYSQ